MDAKQVEERIEEIGYGLFKLAIGIGLAIWFINIALNYNHDQVIHDAQHQIAVEQAVDSLKHLSQATDTTHGPWEDYQPAIPVKVPSGRYLTITPAGK